MGVDARMFVRTRKPVTKALLSAASNGLFDRFGPQHFGFDFDEYEETREGDLAKHADGSPITHKRLLPLHVVHRHSQDGPTLKPRPGEKFIEVSLWTRYYGPGYERGDCLLICGVAEYLERALSGRVWYGGDSSGICAAPFGANEREALRAHFAKHGHAPYYGTRESGPTCARCGVSMVRYSWGPMDDAGYSCACGDQIHVHNGVKTLTTWHQRRSAYYDARSELFKDATPKQLAALRAYNE